MSTITPLSNTWIQLQQRKLLQVTSFMETQLLSQLQWMKMTVLSKLIKADNKLDPICLPFLQTLFRAIKELLTRMIPEHLPEGQFWNTSPAVRKQATSVMKHNKLHEFIFGQLDHLPSFVQTHLCSQMRHILCMHSTKPVNG